MGEHEDSNQKESSSDEDHQQIEKPFDTIVNILVVEDPCKGEARDDVEDNESGVDIGHHEELLLASEGDVDVNLHAQVWKKVGEPAEANEEGECSHGSGESEGFQGLHLL